MLINQIIIYILVLFVAVGALDKIFGDKFGFGKKFDEGFNAMGPLALAMVGIISLAPVISRLLSPILVPIYTKLGADPAMFAGSLLAVDMGGYPLAMNLAQSASSGLFSGIILGSMMGATIVFTIPVALGILDKRDLKYLALGTLAGIIMIPFGCFFAGLIAGFGVVPTILNLIPVALFAAILAIGLWLIPKAMVKGFVVFGKVVMAIITFGLLIAVIQSLTNITIIPGMAPIWDGIKSVGSVAIMLLGAFPLVHFITLVLKKPLTKLGQSIGLGEIAVVGMIASLANNIPMLCMIKDMDNRGKMLNIAFAVGAAFIFGDHLGFVAGVDQSMIFPMIVGKFTTGILAMVVASFIYSKSKIANQPE